MFQQQYTKQVTKQQSTNITDHIRRGYQAIKDSIHQHKQSIIYYSPLMIALFLCIAVICIVPISVNFFSYLFLVSNNQLLAKQYLKMYFTNDMALLYFAIIGFVICVINSFVYKFTKFTQKTKILWVHTVFYIIFMALGIGSQSKSELKQTMRRLSNLNPASTICTQRIFQFQCLLSKAFLQYQSKQLGFIIAFCILFAIYSTIYYYNSINQLNKLIQDNDNDNKDKNKNSKDEITNNDIVCKSLQKKKSNIQMLKMYYFVNIQVTLINQIDENVDLVN